MDKDKNDIEQDKIPEEIDWEDFFSEDDVEWDRRKERARKRRSLFVKTISVLLVFSLLVTGLQVWFNLFNLPAIEFVKVSNRLSKDPKVKEYMQSVVTIEWNGVKGTGFLIASDGMIVTNEHVVEHTEHVNVHLKSGSTFIGKVIAKDPSLDLALVDINSDNLPYLQLNFENELENWDGEKIIFIGNPLSFTQIANEGRVIGQVSLEDWSVPVLMIEAPIYKGNSGSPVINQSEEVIGVIFATLPNPNINTNEIVGVAIPATHIQKLLEKVK